MIMILKNETGLRIENNCRKLAKACNFTTSLICGVRINNNQTEGEIFLSSFGEQRHLVFICEELLNRPEFAQAMALALEIRRAKEDMTCHVKM